MKLLVVASMLTCCMLAGCSSGEKGKELFETAQFEEKQNNKPHAIKLYEELIAKYPNTELARQAQERLTVLQQGK